MPDMSIWNVSRVLTLYQTSPFFACITAFSFSNFLGVRVSRFGVGADGILYLVGLQPSVFISWRVALSPPCGVRNSVMQNSDIGIHILATDEHLKKLIGP